MPEQSFAATCQIVKFFCGTCGKEAKSGLGLSTTWGTTWETKCPDGHLEYTERAYPDVVHKVVEQDG